MGISFTRVLPQQGPCKVNLRKCVSSFSLRTLTGQEGGDCVNEEALPSPSPGQLLRSPRRLSWEPRGAWRGRTKDKPARPTLCGRRESLSSTQGWAVTSGGSLLTETLDTEPRRLQAASESAAQVGDRYPLQQSASLPRPPADRTRPLCPYLRVSVTCKLCWQTQPAQGLSLHPASRLYTHALWAASQPPAAAGGHPGKETGFSFSPPSLLPAAQGAISSGLVRGILRASSGKGGRVCVWLRRRQRWPGTRRRWRRQPVSRGGGQARGSANRAPASLALRQAGGRAALRVPAPRRGPPQAPAGMPGPAARWARAAAERAGSGRPRLPLSRCLLPGSLAPGLHVSGARAPTPLPPPCRHSSTPQPGALLARSHSTAYRLTPCMPPGPRAAPGLGRPGGACCGPGKRPQPLASVSHRKMAQPAGTVAEIMRRCLETSQDP